MADVKWIKITTDIFDDEKILLIESMPDAYAIITCWFKLLCLAGKTNNGGVFMMGQMAYTDDMLSTIFRMNKTTVQLALATFEKFGMVEILDGVITIPNWSKHQNLDAFDKKKEYDRRYQAKKREERKALIGESYDSRTTSRLTSNDSSISLSISKSSSKDEGCGEKETTKPVRHKHGQYLNVLLSDEDLAKLQAEFPEDWQARIEHLSSYMASSGKSYKNHLATIRNWAARDGSKPVKPAKEPQPTCMSRDDAWSYV